MPFDWIKEFQVVQEKISELKIFIVHVSKAKVKKNALVLLEKIVRNRMGKIVLKVKIVNNIKKTKSGKWKFILNKIDKK